MRRLLPLVLLAATFVTFTQTALAQSTPKPADILAAENLFWTNYTSGNTAGLSKQLAPDFTSMEQERWNRDQVLNFVGMFFKQCSLAPVKLVAPKVIFLTPAIATLTYHAIESPTCAGRTMSGDTNISTVWVLRDGRWLMHLHTEYAIPAKK
jgi:hypothetical protein